MTAQTTPYDETRPRDYRTLTMILTTIIKLLLFLATQSAAAILIGFAALFLSFEPVWSADNPQAMLAKPDDFAGLNEAYSKFFPKDQPTRSVAKLGVEFPNVLVAIKVVAVIAE